MNHMKEHRQCPWCKELFENIEGRVFSNHVKWCKDNPNSSRETTQCEICKKEISSQVFSNHYKICKEKHDNRKKCPECNELVPPGKTFCNSSCSAKFSNKNRKNCGLKKGTVHKDVQRDCKECNGKFMIKSCISNEMYLYCEKCRERLFPIKIVISNCVICNTAIPHCHARKTCSKECKSKLMAINSRVNKNCGGQTNYKKYIYKNISMDSSWEVKIAEFMDNLNIKWERSKKLCLFWIDENNNNRRYHPDFYLPEFDVYLDTKNKYLMKQDEFKISRVKANNSVKLIVDSLDNVKMKVLQLLFPN